MVTEGTSTEPMYLTLFWRIHGSEQSVLHPIPLGQDPRRVVERAVLEREKSLRDPDAEFDSYWAMFDRDDHTRYQEAVQLAEGKKIHIAISNPSFELWAILHYELQDGPTTREECQRKLRTWFPGFQHGKRFTDEAAIEHQYIEAVNRALTLLARRLEERTPLGNPSTTVHELTEFLRIGNEGLNPRGAPEGTVQC